MNTQNPRTQHARRIYALAPHAGGAEGDRASGDSPLPSRSDSRLPKDESLTDSNPSLPFVSLSRPDESPDPTRRVAAEAITTRRCRAGHLRGHRGHPSTSTKKKRINLPTPIDRKRWLFSDNSARSRRPVFALAANLQPSNAQRRKGGRNAADHCYRRGKTGATGI